MSCEFPNAMLLFIALYSWVTRTILGKPRPETMAVRRIHSTVTDFARFRGLSTSVPLAKAV